jgi:hypothetical protein
MLTVAIIKNPLGYKAIISRAEVLLGTLHAPTYKHLLDAIEKWEDRTGNEINHYDLLDEGGDI